MAPRDAVGNDRPALKKICGLNFCAAREPRGCVMYLAATASQQSAGHRNAAGHGGYHADKQRHP